jgi:hypothetical protein
VKHAPSDSHSRVITCRGARSAESRLFEELAAISANRLEQLAQPVRVVVPSKSLRRHLLRRLVVEFGGSAGIVVQTLHGLAREVLDNGIVASPRGNAGFEVLVRRLARGERALRAALDEFDEGYESVIGAVRDLLDAGFEPALEDGVLEKLEELEGTVAGSRLSRARALVRLASKTHLATDELAVWRLARAAQLAEDELATDSELLPARALFVYGFADVTGVAADLLRVVVRCARGTVIVDRPPDPADAARDDAGVVFLDRLLQGFSHLDLRADDREPGAADLQLLEAPDPESEMRWVAERVTEALRSGCAPEDIGVVARGLETMGPVIRRHFRRLGIPFSGVGASVPGPSRRLHRVADLLARGVGSEVDLWTEAWGDRDERSELLLGLRTLGVLRVADAASLEPTRDLGDGVRLPLAFGDDENDGGEGEGEASDPRLLSTAVLDLAATRARDFVRSLADWPHSATSVVHRDRTLEVLRALGWTPATDDWCEVDHCLAELSDELPLSFALERDEWIGLVGNRLRARGQVPIGGAGGGVQVLTVMEARTRTFSLLFVVAVNRGLFPRVLADDALLPEALRARLAGDVLPHMPVRARSADEERYLFAQLVSSAPAVCLSWHLAAGDAKLSRSPFVDRLALRADAPAVQRARALWEPEGGNERVRPAWEHAVVAAVRAGGDGIEPLLGVALAEGASGQPESEAAARELASARSAVLAAVEAQPDAGFGPWSGFVGAAAGVGDDAPWVTHLEGIATCPWRAFVNRRLGVQPLADPHLDLPDPGARLAGLVVHEVLAAIVQDAVGERVADLGGAIGRTAVAVRWPDAEEFEELLRGAALRVARKEGLAALGLGALLAARARPFLEVARLLEWGEGGMVDGVLASEVPGAVETRDAEAPLAFRADRVGRERGVTLLVDYKTGAPWTKLKGEGKRRRDVLARVARGRGLQAVAYALAPAGGGLGRYVFLKPEIEGADETRIVDFGSDDEEAVGLFAEAVGAVGAARKLGVVFPRVEEADSDEVPVHCKYCAVAECCLRDDSQFRQRLVGFMAAKRADAVDAETAARRLWWLGVEREEGS